ncbi:histidine phosphatase family protein [Patescibacteria group bacterium]
MSMPIEIVVVRHGQSEGNVAIRILEEQGLPVPAEYSAKHTVHWRLTSKGVEQAQIAGQWIRENLDFNFFRYYVSDYDRAKETAGHLALPSAQWMINFFIGERNWGILDRYTAEERFAKFQTDFQAKTIHPFYWTPPRGESMVDLCLRLDKVLGTLYRECADKRVILVCHGEVMWGLRVILERMTPDKFVRLDKSKNPKHRIHNCQILHYTRKNPRTGIIQPYFGWVKSVCPTDLSRSINKWQAIKRPKFSNQELLDFVEKNPRIIDNV